MTRVIGTYQMLWNCPQCGTKGLLGKDHRHCPACGAAQNPEARYFPEPGTEQEVTNYEYIGVDRTCPYCQTPNAAKATHCGNCGGALDGSTPVALIDQTAVPQQAIAAPVANRGCAKKVIFAVVGFLILLIALCSWKKEVTVSVEGHRWERNIAIERFEPRRQSEWCDSMPGDAYSVSRSREQRSTRQIADGEECSTSNRDNGDGTFSRVENCSTKYRSEPVYDTKCSFTVDRWGEARSVASRGSSLAQAPQWPQALLAQSGQCKGCEREGKRTEQYFVSLKSEDEVYECVVNAALWQRLEDGKRIPIRVRVVGGGVDCPSLEE